MTEIVGMFVKGCCPSCASNSLYLDAATRQLRCWFDGCEDPTLAARVLDRLPVPPAHRRLASRFDLLAGATGMLALHTLTGHSEPLLGVAWALASFAAFTAARFTDEKDRAA